MNNNNNMEDDNNNNIEFVNEQALEQVKNELKRNMKKPDNLEQFMIDDNSNHHSNNNNDNNNNNNDNDNNNNNDMNDDNKIEDQKKPVSKNKTPNIVTRENAFMTFTMQTIITDIQAIVTEWRIKRFKMNEIYPELKEDNNFPFATQIGHLQYVTETNSNGMEDESVTNLLNQFNKSVTLKDNKYRFFHPMHPPSISSNYHRHVINKAIRLDTNFNNTMVFTVHRPDEDYDKDDTLYQKYVTTVSFPLLAFISNDALTKYNSNNNILSINAQTFSIYNEDHYNLWMSEFNNILNIPTYIEDETTNTMVLNRMPNKMVFGRIFKKYAMNLDNYFKMFDFITEHEDWSVYQDPDFEETQDKIAKRKVVNPKKKKNNNNNNKSNNMINNNNNDTVNKNDKDKDKPKVKHWVTKSILVSLTQTSILDMYLHNYIEPFNKEFQYWNTTMTYCRHLSDNTHKEYAKMGGTIGIVKYITAWKDLPLHVIETIEKWTKDNKNFKQCSEYIERLQRNGVMVGYILYKLIADFVNKEGEIDPRCEIISFHSLECAGDHASLFMFSTLKNLCEDFSINKVTIHACPSKKSKYYVNTFADKEGCITKHKANNNTWTWDLSKSGELFNVAGKELIENMLKTELHEPKPEMKLYSNDMKDE